MRTIRSFFLLGEFRLKKNENLSRYKGQYMLYIAVLGLLHFVSGISPEAVGHVDKNISKMGRGGFDVIIVCTSTPSQALYWQKRLDATKGTIMPPKAVVLGVDEDWNGKAGNGMGTLYAFVKGAAKAREHGLDLQKGLDAGDISVAIYHTAGKIIDLHARTLASL